MRESFTSLTFEMIPPISGSHRVFNTYDDLYLVPTTRPIIDPPSVKTKKIEVPGTNGVIDLTESLTPYPVYNNRTGSIDFAVLNDKMHWAALYSKIMNYLHGRRAKVVLEEDKNWYYDGRWALKSWKPDNSGKWPTVNLEYDLSPFKLSTRTSTELDDDWLWDPFSFYDGVIHNKVDKNYRTYAGLFTNMVVNSSSFTDYGVLKPGRHTYKLFADVIGWAPIVPTITFSNSNMGIKIVNQQLGYDYEKTYNSAGTYTDPECVLYDWTGDGFQLYLKGNGNVTIVFRKGSL